MSLKKIIFFKVYVLALKLHFIAFLFLRLYLLLKTIKIIFTLIYNTGRKKVHIVL